MEFRELFHINSVLLWVAIFSTNYIPFSVDREQFHAMGLSLLSQILFQV